MALRSWRLGIILTLCAACAPDGSAPTDSPYLALRDLDVPRVSTARFSVSDAYRACRATELDIGFPGPCDPGSSRPPASLTRNAGRIAARARAQSSAEALHAAALLDIIWSDGRAPVEHRALQLLDAALAARNRQADVLSDIAAVHLWRAESAGELRAPLEAADAAARALEVDPRHPAALFNLALAREWMGLTREGARAWRAYLSVDSTSGWADEARRRSRALEHVAERRSPPAPADWPALARHDPQRLRERVWDTILAEWGEAWLAGDSLRARQRLALAHSAGEALAGMRGDSSILVMHDDIAAAAEDPARSAMLARALAAHGRARAAYMRGDYTSSGRTWDELAAAPAPAQLQPWITLFRAATLVYRRRANEGERLIRDVIAAHDEGSKPDLVGRARWILGTTLLRSGRAREALGEYEEAEERFDQAGESLNAAAALSLQAETFFVLGDEAEALARGRRAIAGLTPWGPTVWLHNLLFVTAQSAARAGLPRAARAFADEDVAIASALPVAIYGIEARIARAALSRLASAPQDARSDLEAARQSLTMIPSGGAAEWMRANLLIAEAALAADEAPAAAIARFDTALTLIGPADLFRRLPVRAGRARAMLALDSVAAAEREHGLAVAGLERISSGIYESTQRLLLIGDLDRLTTRLAGRLLADGDTVGALLVTERGRSRVASTVPSRAALASTGARPGHLTIAYAFLGDTLVTWRSSANGLAAGRRPGSRDAILAAIAETNGRLALGVADGRTDSLLVRLHEWLVAGLMPPASDSAVLTIVADGELADAPFAALRDGATGRHLIQDVELRFAPSVVMERQRRREGPAAVVTAIGVSAGDPQRGLVPLAGAERESGEVASLYQMGRAIRAAEANAGRVAEALGSSRVVHFAAHAVADPVRPLESFVLLGGGGRLAAREVAAMQLEGLELVVMAACETQRAAEGGAGTMAGLTWAFLRAGARGVIGSSWRVDDEATRRLMLAMHRRHAGGTSAVAALREAQLEMLGDGDARWRSPASWAGFRYATATNH